MKSSNNPAASAITTVIVPRKSLSPRVRLPFLLGLLGLFAALLVISRRYVASSRPAPPPASAGANAAMRYYAGRIQADPSDVEAYVELGRQNEAAGYFTEALRQLTVARALGAKDRDILLPLGRALTHLARFEQAQAELEKAARLMPDSLEAAANLAGLYDASGKPEQAIRCLRDYLNRHPALQTTPTPQAIKDCTRIMFCLLQAGDDTAALQVAQSLTRLAPDEPGGYSIAGRLLLERGQIAPALAMLEQAARLAPDAPTLLDTYGIALSRSGRLDDALHQWQKAIVHNLDDTAACEQLALAYNQKKDYKREAEALETLALRDFTNQPLVGRTALAFERSGQKIPAAFWRSIEARIRKDYAASLKYAQIVAQDPRWRERGLMGMAQCYQHLRRMDDFLRVTRQATAAHTVQDDITLAAAYSAADRSADEIALLKSILARHPADPARIHQLLAQAASDKGQRDEAEAQLRECVALAPRNPEYHKQLANLYYERRASGDRLAQAVREYEQYARLMPDEAGAYRKLGIVYAASGDWRRAARNLEHALDLQPGDGATYQQLGRVYAQLGDKAGSENMLHLYSLYVAFDLQRQALQTKSMMAQSDPAPQVALAEFMERAGDYSAAAQYYQRAALLRPADTALQARVKRIQTMLGQDTH